MLQHPAEPVDDDGQEQGHGGRGQDAGQQVDRAAGRHHRQDHQAGTFDIMVGLSSWGHGSRR